MSGSKPITCPNCLQENLEYARFCAECGKEVTAANPQTKLDHVTKNGANNFVNNTDGAAEEMVKAKKAFGGLGYTVIILALLSLFFIGDQYSGGLIFAIVICVISGIWLASSPSITAGVVAGVSLIILGIFDLLVVISTGGGFGYIAPLIDFGFAINIFVACGNYSAAIGN